jgi:Cu2+-exporting ATPase
MQHNYCHQEHTTKQHSHSNHTHHVGDFKKRFWISTILTIPILLLSPMIQKMAGLEWLNFPGSLYVLFALSTLVFFYSGWPFLTGIVRVRIITHREHLISSSAHGKYH